MRAEKQWLGPVPWETVLHINQALCQTQKVEPQPNPKNYDAVRRLWETSIPKNMSLEAMLDVCRKCFEMSPFLFNNGNTFAAIGRTLVEDWMKTLPPVEAQILRVTVGHYIAGMIGRKELKSVLAHFEKSWAAYEASQVAGGPGAAPTAAFAPAPAQPQTQ